MYWGTYEKHKYKLVKCEQKNKKIQQILVYYFALFYPWKNLKKVQKKYWHISSNIVK